MRAGSGRMQELRNGLDRLGSTAWTPWWLLLLATAALAADQLELGVSGLVALPLALLGLNLVAALMVRPRLRRDLPLIMLHLALVLILLLSAYHLLVRYETRVILVDGAPYEGLSVEVRRGHLYPGGAEQLRFANEGLQRSYRQDGRLFQIRNYSRWQHRGQPRRGLIGKDEPLQLDGHRVYTTDNWGHAPFLLWQGEEGTVMQVALPVGPWLLGVDRQGLDWQPPGSDRTLWIGLDFGAALDPVHDGFMPGDDPDAVRLVVRDGTRRWLLAPGQSAALPGLGRLAYQKLDTWMGYRISYDPAGTGLFSATLVLVVGLCWYYARKLGNTKWVRGTRPQAT